MNNLRIAGLVCIAVCGAAHTNAMADDTVVVVKPSPDFSAFNDTIKRNQDAIAQTGQNLGRALVAATTPKKVRTAVLVIKCERIEAFSIFYDDNSYKDGGMAGQAIDSAQIATIRAGLPLIQIVDQGCPSTEPSK